MRILPRLTRPANESKRTDVLVSFEPTKKCNWRQKQDVSRQYSKQTNCTGSHKNVLYIMYVAKDTITFFKIWFSWWPVTQNQTPLRAETHFSASGTAVKQHYLYRWRWHLMWNLNPASLLHYNLRPQKCRILAGLLFQRCGVGGGGSHVVVIIKLHPNAAFLPCCCLH